MGRLSEEERKQLEVAKFLLTGLSYHFPSAKDATAAIQSVLDSTAGESDRPATLEPSLLATIEALLDIDERILMLVSPEGLTKTAIRKQIEEQREVANSLRPGAR